MIKKTVLIALMAASSILSVPQIANAEDDPNAPPCNLGCVFIWNFDSYGNPTGGHWECNAPSADCVGN